MRTLIARTLSVVVVAVASLFACATGGFAADAGSSESGTGVGTVSDFTANHEVINAVAAGIVDHGGLYGYEGATLDKADDVVAALKGTKVAVAVIPRGEYSRTEVRSIFESVRGLISPEYTTVIGFAQSEEGYVSVASSEDERGAKDIEGIWEDLLNNHGWTTTPGQDVLDNVDTIKDAVAKDSGDGNSLSQGVESVIRKGVLVLVMATVLVGVIGFLAEKPYDRGREEGKDREEDEDSGITAGDVKAEFEKAKTRLLASKETVKGDEDVIDGGLDELSTHTMDLLDVARKRASTSTLNSLYVEFADKFNKISTLIEDYYGPMVKNPEHWESSESKKREIRLSVESVEREVREALQRLTDDSYVEVEAIMESLTGHDL